MNQLLRFTLVILIVNFVAGISRRCYQCRSRGKDGDCKDPFGFNETTIAERIHISPCPSGWCSKFIEGISGPPDGSLRWLSLTKVKPASTCQRIKVECSSTY